MNLPLKITSMPRRRECSPKCRGLPRRKQLRLSERENMECGLSGPPRGRWATPRRA